MKKTSDRMYLEGMLALCSELSNEARIFFPNSEFERGMSAAYKVVAEGIASHLDNECKSNIEVSYCIKAP